jgi:glyoxylase-like metal-dependent hydrolase (beta-lactamase superfamily II)
MRLPAWCALVRAGNPGPMTLDGTNTWVLRPAPGAPAVVIDPGPLLDAHLAAVATLGPVAAVLLTHRHVDHAQGAHRFHELTGAPVRAREPSLCVDAAPLAEGGVVDLDGLNGLAIRVLTTPGHTSDSVAFLVDDPAAPAVLTGDTILGRGTAVVAHPDGRLGDYLASLDRLRALGDLLVLPGHGPPRAGLGQVAADYLNHRMERLAQVEAAVEACDRTPGEVVRRVYADVAPALWPAAELSVRAQLDYLAERALPPDRDR